MQTDEIKARRLTAMIQRYRSGMPWLRLMGSAAMIVIAGSTVVLAWTSLDLQPTFWIIVASIIVILVGGSLGEMIGRTIEERGLDEFDLVLALYVACDIDSKGVAQLKSLSDNDNERVVSRLRLLVTHSHEDVVRAFASEAICVLNAKTSD